MGENYEASLFYGLNSYRVSGPETFVFPRPEINTDQKHPEILSAGDLVERVDFYGSNIINSENSLLMSIYNRENEGSPEFVI